MKAVSVLFIYGYTNMFNSNGVSPKNIANTSFKECFRESYVVSF